MNLDDLQNLLFALVPLGGIACSLVAAWKTSGSANGIGRSLLWPFGCLLAWIATFLIFGPTFGRHPSVDSPAPNFIIAQQWLVAMSLVVLALLAVRFVATSDPNRRQLAHLAGACFVAALLVRVGYPNTLLHSEQFGTKLLADIVRFPQAATFRSTYGQSSFFVLGFFSWLFHSHHAAFVANKVIGSLTCAVLAILVSRWTKSPLAAVFTGLVAALHPGLVRICASEDANNLALFFISLSTWALDTFSRSSGNGTPLMIGQLALVLAVWTRQTAWILAPLPLLVLWDQGNRAAYRRPDVIATLLTVFAAVLFQAAHNTYHDSRSFYGIVAFLKMAPGRFFGEPHPLLDPAVTPAPVILLWIVGLISCFRGQSTKRHGLGLTFCLVLLASGLFTYGGPGMRLLFRAPVFLVSTLMAGLGFHFIFGPSSWKRKKIGWAIALTVLTVAGATYGLLRQSFSAPLYREIAFLERTLPLLPKNSTIVVPRFEDFKSTLHQEAPKPNWIFPDFLLADTEIKKVSVMEWRSGAEALRCPFFYRSLLCYTLALGEASPRFNAFWQKAMRLESAELEKSGGDISKYDLWAEGIRLLIDVEQTSHLLEETLLYKYRSLCWEKEFISAHPAPGLSIQIPTPDAPYVPNVVYPASEMRVGFYPLKNSGQCLN